MAILLAGALLPCGCRARPTPEECDRLLDRYTELLVRQDAARVTRAEIDAAQAEARARAATHPAFARCTREVSRESMDCALAAHDPDQIERCLIPIPLAAPVACRQAISSSA